MDEWIICTKGTRLGGLRNWGCRAVTVLQNGTVGRIYKSAPTVCVDFMDEWIICTKGTRLGGLRDLVVQAVTVLRDGILGRAC